MSSSPTRRLAADEPSTGSPRVARRRIASGPWAAAAVGLFCFANSLSNDFTYDDNAIVRDNPRIRSLSNVREIWFSDWWYLQSELEPIPNPKRDRLYRPLTLFTFALNYAAGGLAPFGYHLVNVLLHVAACALVWQLAQRLFGDRTLSACAALLFAVHPIHSEAVANVVGRAEILAALLLLFGLLLLLPRAGNAGIRRWWAAGGAFFLALLTKETAVCYPALALVAVHARSGWAGLGGRRWWSRVGVLLLPLVVYLPLRYFALEQHLLRDRPHFAIFNPLFSADFSERLVGPFTILGQYVRVFLAPTRLSCDYGLAIFDPQAGPNSLTGLGLATAIGMAAALLGYRRRDGIWRRLAVLAAMSAASYVLISNTVLLIGVSMAERLMYWPSVPILLLVATALLGGWRWACRPGGALQNAAPLLRTVGVLLLVAFGVRGIFRNTAWADDYRLFTADARAHPNGVHLNNAFAREMIKLAERTADANVRAWALSQAENRLAAALDVFPRGGTTLHLRGWSRALRGETDAAVRDLETAVQLDANDKFAKRYLAKLRGSEQERQRLVELERELEQRPDDAGLRVEIATLLLGSGRHHDALVHLEHAAEKAPDDLSVLRTFGQTLALNYQPERAMEAFRKVLARQPNDWKTHVNLCALLAETDPPAALIHARQAHRINPQALETNQNLAEALAINGLRDEAIAQYRLIVRGLAEDDPLRDAILHRIEELRRRGR